MNSLWYKEEIFLSGSSRDQPSIRISKIKSASDVSFIHKMPYGVRIGRKRPKMHGRFGECIRRKQSHSSTATIGAENDGCHAQIFCAII